MYTFNILMLSNRDSLAFAEQVYETLAYAQLQAVMADVGYAPESFTVARRDLRNIVPDELTGVSTPGASRLLAGADLVLVAVPDPADRESGVQARLEKLRGIARKASLPIVMWSPESGAEPIVFARALAARVFGVEGTEHESADSEVSARNPVGVVVSSSAVDNHDSLGARLSGWIEQGRSVTIISGGSPDDDSAASELGSRFASPHVSVSRTIDSQRDFVTEVRACTAIATDSPAVAAIASALGTLVLGFGSNSRVASLTSDLAESSLGTESAASDTAAQRSYQQLFALLAPVLRPSSPQDPASIVELASTLSFESAIDERQVSRLRSIKSRRVASTNL